MPNPDLVIRVAANIAALQSDMAAAVATIKAIEGAATQAATATSGFQKSLDKMGDSFVARITEGILLRDAIREIIRVGEEAFTNAAKFDDLAKATGVSIQAIQQFNLVGQEFGLGADEMARGVEQLSARLAKGDASATKAVEMLGLSVSGLIAMGPQAAFLAVADAAGRVEDPMMRGGIAADLFGGKLAKLLLPVLGELRTKFDEASKSGAIMSDETVKAAHEFEVGWAHAVTTVEANIAEFAVWVAAHARSAFADSLGIKDIKALGDIELPKSGSPSEAIDNATLLQNRLIALRTEALEPLTEAQQQNIDSLHKWGVSETEMASLVGSNVVAVKLYIEGQKAAAEAAKKLAEVEAAQIAETAKLWDAYYISVNGASHDTVQRRIDDAYLAADAQIAALEKTKKLTVEGYAIIWNTARQTADNIIQKTLESDSFTKEHYALLADEARIAYEFALDHASSYTAQEIQLFNEKYRAAEQASAHWAAQASADMDKAAAHGKTAAASLGESIISLQSTLSMADAAMNADLASTVKNVQTLAGAYITASQAKIAFDSGGSFNVPVIDITDKNKASYIARLKQIEADYVNFPGRAPGGNGLTGLSSNDAAGWSAMLQEQVEFASLKAALPGYAGGVQNAPGGFAIVGEHGPETMFVPKGANIYPAGNGVAATVIHNYYITHPLGTPAAIAAAVGDAFIDRQRTIGTRFPTGA